MAAFSYFQTQKGRENVCVEVFSRPVGRRISLLPSSKWVQFGVILSREYTPQASNIVFVRSRLGFVIGVLGFIYSKCV